MRLGQRGRDSFLIQDEDSAFALLELSEPAESETDVSQSAAAPVRPPRLPRGALAGQATRRDPTAASRRLGEPNRDTAHEASDRQGLEGLDSWAPDFTRPPRERMGLSHPPRGEERAGIEEADTPAAHSGPAPSMAAKANERHGLEGEDEELATIPRRRWGRPLGWPLVAAALAGVGLLLAGWHPRMGYQSAIPDVPQRPLPLEGIARLRPITRADGHTHAELRRTLRAAEGHRPSVRRARVGKREPSRFQAGGKRGARASRDRRVDGVEDRPRRVTSRPFPTRGVPPPPSQARSRPPLRTREFSIEGSGPSPHPRSQADSEFSVER